MSSTLAVSQRRPSWTSCETTPTVAFTLGELAQELSKTDVTLDDLDYALRALVEGMVIEVKPRDDRLYYMYRSLR